MKAEQNMLINKKQSSATGKMGKKEKYTEFWKYFKVHYWLYIMVIPGLLYLLLFHYVPMYGLAIPFFDYSPVKGLAGSAFVGLKNFQYLFKSPDFLNVLKNSLVLSFEKLAFGFPAPLILALIINEIRRTRVKKVIQTVVYIPHFVSWVVMSGIIISLLSSDGGIINKIVVAFGGEKINFLINSKYFRPILVITDIWKEVGWGTIVYLAAMSGIDVSLYEAAQMDGAGRFKQILYITIPGIVPTMIVLLVLRMGSVLGNGFEQVFLLYSPSVYDVGDVLETFTYRLGLLEGRYSFATAVGMFQSFVGLIFIYVSNKLAAKAGGALW